MTEARNSWSVHESTSFFADFSLHFFLTQFSACSRQFSTPTSPTWSICSYSRCQRTPCPYRTGTSNVSLKSMRALPACICILRHRFMKSCSSFMTAFLHMLLPVCGVQRARKGLAPCVLSSRSVIALLTPQPSCMLARQFFHERCRLPNAFVISCACLWWVGLFSSNET